MTSNCREGYGRRFMEKAWRICLLVVFGLIMSSVHAAANPGDIDPAFDPGAGAEKKPVIYGLLQDSSTTFLAYGSFARVNGSSYANIVKIDSTGAVDASFTPPSINGEVRALAKRGDGKFLAGGNFSITQSSPYYYDLALLEADGALNTGFWSAFAGQGTINALAVQTDDYVLCGGYALQLSQVSVDPTRHLVRIQSNGFADGTYPVFNGPRAYVTGLAVDSDLPQYPNRLTVYGAFNTGVTTQINWQGALDNAGAVIDVTPDDADTDGPILNIIDASNDKTYVVGNFSKAYGHAANRILRRNADGGKDTSFNIGSGPNGDVTGAYRLSDDSVILVGAFTAFNGASCNRIVRLTSSGAVDTSFVVNNGANAPILSIVPLSDGSLALTGAFTTYQGQTRYGLAAIAQNGSLLSAFSGFTPEMSGTVKIVVHDLVAQPNGKILIGGDFNWFGGVFAPNVARLNADGSPDAGFSAGLGPDGAVRDVALDGDGNVLVGGDIGGVATRPIGGVARLLTDGAVDTVFKPIVTRTDNSPAPVYAVLPLDDGKVLVGGHVRKISGADRSPLGRLNADGGLDAAFDPQIAITSGTSLQAYALSAWQGTYYVGGYVTYESLARGFFTRVTDSGALDATFVPVTPSANVVVLNSSVWEIALQQDDKPVICGDFLEIIDGSWSRPQRRGLARFTTTGGLDSFDSTTGALSLTYVDSLSIEPDGRILFAGGFTTYNGVNRTRLARTLTTGALDDSFDPGTGVPARARVIRRVTRTRGLIGGEFSSYDGVARSGLAGFVLDLQPPVSSQAFLMLLLLE